MKTSRLLAAATFALGSVNFAPVPSLASSSPDFDAACEFYYAQGLDPDVMTSMAAEYCLCLAIEIGEDRTDMLDFLARTYSDDLTTFIADYPKGEAWMEEFFGADDFCKNGPE